MGWKSLLQEREREIKTFHRYYKRAEPLPLRRNSTTMVHVMYICHPSWHGFMTSLKWRYNNNNIKNKTKKQKKENQPTHNENDPKQHKSRKQAFSNIFLKRFFFFSFFSYMSSSSCACRIMKLQRSFRRKANRPLVAALGAARAHPETSFPGQRIRVAGEEMAMSGLKHVTGEPLVCLKYSLLYTSVQVPPIY